MKKHGTRKTLSCPECGSRCCKYVATQIDTPACKRDYDYIRWYLRHERVFVFIDHEGDWYLEFETSCEHLGECGRCLAYDTRPLICRSHGNVGEPCEFHADHEPHERRFETAEDFERYLDDKGVDWRWKKL